MAQFIEYHDTITDSKVIVNKNHIMKIRQEHTTGSGHEDYIIKLSDGTILKVRPIQEENHTHSHFKFLNILNG